MRAIAAGIVRGAGEFRDMSDPIEAHEADWRRRKKIAQKWGGGSTLIGVAALVGYWITMPFLPLTPDSRTGNVYMILNIEGRHSPLFRYGTMHELIIVLALTAIMLVGFGADLTIYYIYNPGAIYRGASRSAR